jgi:hypothetical protein
MLDPIELRGCKRAAVTGPRNQDHHDTPEFWRINAASPASVMLAGLVVFSYLAVSSLLAGFTSPATLP